MQQGGILTIRTNIPRNSARNSLKMSCLRPNFSFIFLLLSSSMVSAPPRGSPSEHNKQQTTGMESVCERRRRLLPPTHGAALCELRATLSSLLLFPCITTRGPLFLNYYSPNVWFHIPTQLLRTGKQDELLTACQIL